MGKIYVSTGAVMTDTPSVKKYMSEIKKAPLLDRDEETALANEAKAGSSKARRRLVECLHRPVGSMHETNLTTHMHKSH